MTIAPVSLLALYSGLTFFSYFNIRHIKAFRGSSLWFLTYLNTHTFVMMVLKWGFLGYWVWKHGMWEGLSLIVCSQLINIAVAFLSFLDDFDMSMLGLLMAPVLMFFLWYHGLAF